MDKDYKGYVHHDMNKFRRIPQNIIDDLDDYWIWSELKKY